jgi:hypothetical protein
MEHLRLAGRIYQVAAAEPRARALIEALLVVVEDPKNKPADWRPVTPQDKFNIMSLWSDIDRRMSFYYLDGRRIYLRDYPC